MKNNFKYLILTVLSLGAGVQSSAMAVMSARSDLPPVDCAIFADTGYEPKMVYKYLELLKKVLKNCINFKIDNDIFTPDPERVNTTGSD